MNNLTKSFIFMVLWVISIIILCFVHNDYPPEHRIIVGVNMCLLIITLWYAQEHRVEELLRKKQPKAKLISKGKKIKNE